MIEGSASTVPSVTWQGSRWSSRFACAIARTGRYLRADGRSRRCFPAVTGRSASWERSASGRTQAEALVIGEHAAVLDDHDPGRLEDMGDVVVADPELEPHDPGSRLHREDVLDVLRD